MTRAAIGIDVGSTSCKGVLLHEDGQLLASMVEPSDPLIESQAERVVTELLEQATWQAPRPPICATGYGRKRVPAAKQLTEITCHARGAYQLCRSAGVLIDIGGQDTKVIRIGEGGAVEDFAMNDKCAAGTGRFLEVILARLRIDYGQLPRFAQSAVEPVAVSSTCTVFAESEVVSLIAQGAPLEGIVLGLHRALASRVLSLAGAIPAEQAVYLSGGVALNPAITSALERHSQRVVNVLPTPQLVGAIGAALSAFRPNG